MPVEGVSFKNYINFPVGRKNPYRVVPHFVGLALDEKHSILKIMFLPTSPIKTAGSKRD